MLNQEWKVLCFTFLLHTVTTLTQPDFTLKPQFQEHFNRLISFKIYFVSACSSNSLLKSKTTYRCPCFGLLGKWKLVWIVLHNSDQCSVMSGTEHCTPAAIIHPAFPRILIIITLHQGFFINLHLVMTQHLAHEDWSSVLRDSSFVITQIMNLVLKRVTRLFLLTVSTYFEEIQLKVR